MADEEEYLIETMDDSDGPIEEDCVDWQVDFSSAATRFSDMVQIYSSEVPDFPATLKSASRVELDIPLYFLPLCLQVVYGFRGHETLLHVELELNSFDWRRPPVLADIRHPVQGIRYVGRPLVVSVVEGFFSSEYRPRSRYRAQGLLLAQTSANNTPAVASLVRQGFARNVASKALLLCGNNVADAAKMLRTGGFASECELDVDYENCPLLYLVLEIAEVFVDLPNHCCICGAAMPAGLKPSVCSGRMCNFQLAEIGVGNSVVEEVKRDPSVADLFVSVFAAASRGRFLHPAPPMRHDAAVVRAIPPMAALAGQFRNDAELQVAIGDDAIALLRWILLSNRSHLISLSGDLEIPEFNSCRQFMTLISSPESEEVFNELKREFGSVFLWHGSSIDRWHSILRTGLKNGTGTPLQQNGAARGSGIYLAVDSFVSRMYSRPGAFDWPNSALGASPRLLALCEVAQIPAEDTTIVIHRQSDGKDVTVSGRLAGHGSVYTCTMEEACVVRCVVANPDYGSPMFRHATPRIPTLEEVLERQAGHVH